MILDKYSGICCGFSKSGDNAYMMLTYTYIQGSQVHILNMSFSILEADDGNSLSDLHTGGKLKVIFLGAPFPHFLNLLDSPLTFLLLPLHPQATLLNTLATRWHSIEPGVI